MQPDICIYDSIMGKLMLDSCPYIHGIAAGEPSIQNSYRSMFSNACEF
jgi:hypothetical protein